MESKILTIAAFVAALGCYAQVDLGSQARMRAGALGVSVGREGVARAKAVAASEPKVRGFVTLSEGASADELTAAGMTVRSVRGNIALVEMPAMLAGTLGSVRAVGRFQAERTVRPHLDKARAVSGIDKIHSGIGLPQGYTGKGVIAGIVDGGFDPNHVNFKNADGTSRIKQFTYYRPTQSGSYVEEVYDDAYIPNIDTEDETTFHGTHTMGIMAGSYRGDVTLARPIDDRGNCETYTGANPYYGVAYEADICASAGATTDYYLALGVDIIAARAWQTGQPAAINMSLGSNVGPHDGSSTICQYIDELTEKENVIVCLSAGNEGDMPIALHKTLTATDNTVKSMLLPVVPMKDYQNVRYGQTYFYSNDATQFEIQAIVVNQKRGVVAMRMPLPATDGAIKYWVSGQEYAYGEDDVISSQFAKWFTGYVGVGAEFDENTGRYYGVLDVMCWDNTAASSNNPDGNYILGFQITGTDGQRIDVFGDGVYNYLSDYGLDGFDDGMTDGTISDVACGKNSIVVGSYNTRDNWPSLDGTVYMFGRFEDGKMSDFTSYGQLYDGRCLPHVCAPGATIISSSNEYYMDAYRLGDDNRQASVEADGRVHTWHQCVGTSMSTPLVTGSIALWLQADPTLKYSDVQDIIKRTSVVDSDVLASGNATQWGAGKFDAYAGLKEVLNRAGVNDIRADEAEVPVTVTDLGGRMLGVLLTGTKSVDAKLFSIAGALVAAARGTDGEARLDASALTSGVYVLNVNGRYARRILIK